MEIPQLRGRAIETTLSHVHPPPSFVFYGQISQISLFLYNAWSSEYFPFLFTNLIIYIEI
jgi:hypothetical protein